MEIPFLGQLATQGILGILLAISLFVNWYFIKLTQSINEKRVEEAKDITSKILEPLNATKANGELLINLFQRFLNNDRA